MGGSVSDHQVRVYEYAKSRPGRWFTIQELSTDSNIPDASAKGHAVRFEEMGIFDRLRASPAHLFRLSEFAATRDPKTVRLLEIAIPVFAERRHERLRRELHALRPPTHFEPFPASPPPLVGLPHHHEPAVVERASGPRDGVVLTESHLAMPRTTAEPSMNGRAQDGAVASSTTPAAVDRRSLDAPRELRRGSKVEVLLAMVSREEGASLDELVAALGNLAHSIRASISVESRKRGLNIECINSRYYLRPGATTAASQM